MLQLCPVHHTAPLPTPFSGWDIFIQLNILFASLFLKPMALSLSVLLSLYLLTTIRTAFPFLYLKLTFDI